MLQPVFNYLRATYPSSQTAVILYASNQAVTGLVILVIWVYAASGHRLIDKTMSRPQIISLALRALLIPMIFIFSLAVIVFRNDYDIYFWLLLIILEVADLVYWRVRRVPVLSIWMRGKRSVMQSEITKKSSGHNNT